VSENCGGDFEGFGERKVKKYNKGSSALP